MDIRRFTQQHVLMNNDENDKARENWPLWPLILMILIFVAPIAVYLWESRNGPGPANMAGAIPIFIGLFFIWPTFGIGILGYSVALLSSSLTRPRNTRL